MLVEHLIDSLGEPLLFGLTLVVVALPLGVVGLALRRRGLAGALRWEVVASARRAVRDLGPGRVAFVGTWRGVAGGRALVEAEGARALVELGPIAPAVRDGERVLVAGFATRQESAPTGAGYREGAQAWLVEAGPEELLVAAPDATERGLRGARLFTALGTVMLAASVAVAVAVGALCYRAALEQAALVGSHVASIG